ncbi:HUA2-like protein 2 [Raphanus sativus]|uniref:Protein HUA2-LIKE 3 n=1 Tax=Raphanus sativus TaxID=3726 RepID=A0A6J0KBQ4_RAPSA|nr:protein HUA2-LIKE 3 [Raphanus sativus]KAJ4884836.1 HUA2-like protein 2 [Raphanus sativus]
MAPSRKKGGGKAAASARREWKVGDLVLAKVKGFPAWPAAVSEPDKWGYSADKKKVFVLFFGTQQIAFCNPADVESFTEEKKISLLTKRHAKGSDFVRAVKEIAESYENLKQQVEANDPKSADETTVGSSGNTIEPPQACENLTGTRLDTQIESNSSHGRDELTLLSEDASAAEQMLALRHNSLSLNVAAKDMCDTAIYSSKRRNERARSQKSAPETIVLPVQHSKLTSGLELDRLQRPLRQCSDGGHIVDDIDVGAIRRRKRIRRSGHSESDDVVSSALNLQGSDEENASEIATVESDNNSRNEGNGVDSGSKVEHSDDVGEGCEGGHELSKGLDFQISTMVKRKKRKPTRKREASDLIDPPAKVEAEEGFGTKACDSCQGSQDSHEKPCAENGDEHLPLVKRARVRMSRVFCADEKGNASSQFEERSSNSPTSAAKQPSPSVNNENDIVSGQDTSAAREFNSFDLSSKLPDDMVDVESSHMEKPSGRMSPSKACIQTVGDKKAATEFHENEFSVTQDDGVARARSNQLGSSPEGNTRVSEVVQGCSEVSQTVNCLNIESDPIDMQCTRQNEKDGLSLNSDTVDLSANNPPSLCPSLDVTASWAPAQSPHQHESQDNDSSDHSLIVVGDSSLKEKCENFDAIAQGVQSQAVEHSQLFCSVLNNQDAENMQESENNLRIEKQGSLELDSGKQGHVIENPAPCATERHNIVKEAEPQCETVYSHCEDAEENKKLEKSCETDEQKEQIQATNSVSVSENFSPEKMRLTPDSPARAIPHSNSVCHISTVESANGMQSNSNFCTSVQFGEKKPMSDDTVKEERKDEIGVTEVKKVISDVQFTIESFETALSSLVRTKETIGRATRLAMDLVKFGVSAKAMEILAHTLESESNLQRRVDLFFLVDSIAQCSKGLSGDAGGVYLSSIQVMLPRLLAAAVPAGATTQENRQQCLKVLKLWLERRILPESIVRHHIRELDSHSNVPACLYSRRSARTERALDDPVRDMEGMLVDEYGSNSTLQLDGFCMPAMLKVEDEGSDSDGEFESVTPEHESRILEGHVTPSVTERHTRILEDVDGELEMEDVAPPWDVGSSAPTDQAGNTESANCQPVFGTSHQNVTSSSPLAPPSQNAQCAMSDTYPNGFDRRGYPSMHGDHQTDIPRMNPLPVHYRSPESSYSSRASLSKSMAHGEDSNFQHGPYPPPPPSHHYYSYMEPDHHRKPRREAPSYPHRSHYTPDFEERNYHDGHERMRPAPCESRDNWRYHPPYSHGGSRYHDRQKGSYQSSSYSGHQHRDYGRFENDRWSHSPRAYNNRHSFHYKQHSEGPAPVAMRDPPGTWHQR